MLPTKTKIKILQELYGLDWQKFAKHHTFYYLINYY